MLSARNEHKELARELAGVPSKTIHYKRTLEHVFMDGSKKYSNFLDWMNAKQVPSTGPI